MTVLQSWFKVLSDQWKQTWRNRHNERAFQVSQMFLKFSPQLWKHKTKRYGNLLHCDCYSDLSRRLAFVRYIDLTILLSFWPLLWVMILITLTTNLTLRFLSPSDRYSDLTIPLTFWFLLWPYDSCVLMTATLELRSLWPSNCYSDLMMTLRFLWPSDRLLWP